MDGAPADENYEILSVEERLSHKVSSRVLCGLGWAAVDGMPLLALAGRLARSGPLVG